MRYSQCLLGVLALTTRLVNAISPPDTLVEKKSHYLFDSAPPGAQWVNTLGEIVLPKKYEWGHYAVKELNLESTRCEGNKTSSHEGLERRAPVRRIFQLSIAQAANLNATFPLQKDLSSRLCTIMSYYISPSLLS